MSQPMDNSSKPSLFFVSGMIRSGTSLVASLLNSVPGIFCSSELLFQTFIASKKEFLKTSPVIPYHVLGNYFPSDHPTEALTKFLTDIDFASTYKAEFQQKSSQAVGDKEVLCEEFIPFFVGQGVKVVHIIRDPRDVIASIHTGEGDRYTGTHRPVLFDLRNWRKSIAFAMLMDGNAGYSMIRYEDLINKPGLILKELVSFLTAQQLHENEVDSITISRNSSHKPGPEKLYSSSIGQGFQKLNKETIDFIEVTCMPEMIWSGYLKECLPEALVKKKIERFADPFPCIRTEFSGFDYQVEKLLETERYAMLKMPWKEEFSAYFVSEKVFEMLKFCVR